MSSNAIRCAALLLLCAVAGSPVSAQSPAGASDIRRAPEPWRSFLLAARRADALPDRLQRCLAFPDFPGTHWPKGLARQHCEYSAGPGFDLNVLARHVDTGDVAWMERTFRRLQDRHFSEADFSEHIHSAFELFDGGDESGRVSKRWLELAPESAFAMTARADYYLQAGWDARGQAWIQNTPVEQQRMMMEYHHKALPLYRHALQKEPKLLQAYVGMISLSRNGEPDNRQVFALARKVDPACKVLMSAQMDALKPRWGGSYPQMIALDREMVPYMARRPLLAISRARPYQDLGDELAHAKRWDEAASAVEPMLDASTSPQIQKDLAKYLAKGTHPDPWREQALRVAATRFLGRSP